MSELFVQALKVLGVATFVHLSVICPPVASYSRSSVESSSFLCFIIVSRFIAATFTHKSSNSAFRFPFPPSLNWILLSLAINFQFIYHEFREISLDVVLLSRPPCLIPRQCTYPRSRASNFGTRSLICWNLEMGYTYLTHISHKQRRLDTVRNAAWVK